MENENAAYFQAVQEEAMASSTKKLYNLKLKAFIKFLMENYPEGLQSSVETGELEIVLPVQDSILTEWMGKVCRNKRGEMLSYSVVEQARAAMPLTLRTMDGILRKDEKIQYIVRLVSVMKVTYVISFSDN